MGEGGGRMQEGVAGWGQRNSGPFNKTQASGLHGRVIPTEHEEGQRCSLYKCNTLKQFKMHDSITY